MKIETKFNPDGTMKSLKGEAPNLNALAWLCVNVIYKMASDGYMDTLDWVTSVMEFAPKDNAQKAIDSLTKDEVAALCWTGDEE